MLNIEIRFPLPPLTPNSRLYKFPIHHFNKFQNFLALIFVKEKYLHFNQKIYNYVPLSNSFSAARWLIEQL